MSRSDINKNNAWLKFLEKGKDVPLAVNKREDKTKDHLAKLKAKYGPIPIPVNNPTRLISVKQIRGIKTQEGER